MYNQAPGPDPIVHSSLLNDLRQSLFSFFPTMNLSLQSETALIYLMGSLTMLLRNSLVQSRWSVGKVRKWELFVVDFCTVVLPMFLAQTFFADHLPFMTVAMLALGAISFMLCGARAGMTPLRALRPLRVDSARAQRDSHTMFRALLLITTALAILAVDFTLLPRRMAKTQYYGQSLMDTGTAAFVFVNALADHDASERGQSPRQRAAKATMQIFAFRIPTLLALFLIGVGRSVFIQLSGYGQSVTEYGVHWNFFVTLFFLRVFVILVPFSLLIPVGLLFGVGYQTLLRSTQLEQWILRDDFTHSREGLIDQNREGIFSMCGYCFIYALSLQYARFSAYIMSRDKKLSPLSVVAGLSFSLACLCVQQVLETQLGLLASRRLANVSYAFAMLALFSATCSMMLFSQIVVPMPQNNNKGGLLEAISRNALLHFLAANLLTGLVNLTVIPFLRVHGHTVAETVTMLLYAFVTSLLIYFIHLSKKRSQQHSY